MLIHVKMLIGGMPAIRLAIAEDVVGVGHRGDARRQRGGIGDLGKRHHETVEIVVVVLFLERPRHGIRPSGAPAAAKAR
jgi:hypothetical protein